MVKQVRWIVGVAISTAALLSPMSADAQTREFQACSQGALLNCADIRLTSQLGVGPSSTNLLEIGIKNLGSLATPSLATSIYFASFGTGQATDANVVDNAVTPTAVGGASVSDDSTWNLFESGDAIFLSSLTNSGVGGCVSGAPVGGFGQMGQTCGLGQFITFSFFTTRAFDLNAIVLSGLEFVGLDQANTADSCNDVTTCVISTPVSTVPEPSSLALMLAGAASILAIRARRRSQLGEV